MDVLCSGPNPMKDFSASIDATLKFQPIREGWSGHLANLIGWNFSVASIQAEKTFIGLGPGLYLDGRPPGNSWSCWCLCHMHSLPLSLSLTLSLSLYLSLSCFSVNSKCCVWEGFKRGIVVNISSAIFEANTDARCRKWRKGVKNFCLNTTFSISTTIKMPSR